MNRVTKILLSPYFIAFILASVILPFLPPFFTKYVVHQEGKGATRKEKNEVLFYQDLDGDGNSERISSHANSIGHAIQVFDHTDGIIAQKNFSGTIPEKEDRLFFGDQDADGIQEIYAFTQSDDSLFLHGFEVLDTLSPVYFQNKLITLLWKRDGKIEYSIEEEYIIDFNGDSVRDIIIPVGAEFSRQPRQIFLLDIHNDTLLTSPKSGITPFNLQFTDLNGDTLPEIICSTDASENVPDSLNIPYSDYSGWLLCFSTQLDFLFEPIEFPGFHSDIYALPFLKDDHYRIIALYNHIGPLDKVPTLNIYDVAGQLLYSRTLTFQTKIPRIIISEKFPDSSFQYFLIENGGPVYSIDEQLNTILITTLRIDRPEPIRIDLDKDGIMEKIFKGAYGNNYVVTRQDFSSPVIFETSLTASAPYIYSIKDEQGSDRLFYLQKGYEYELFTYSLNPLFNLRYLIYVGIYLGILLLVWLIMKLQSIRIKKHHEIKARLLELQLKSINNQLDPHFTFNAFNSIAAIIHQGDRDEAYRTFAKFTGMIRSNLVSSNKIIRTIDEEITFVRSYLELQKLRFKDQFNYEISIGENVNLDTLVPKMVMQSYVENSIKHGLRHKKESGRLMISINKEGRGMIITIEDNGIGREAAKAFSKDSTAIGLQIMEQFYILFREYYKVRISHEIIDLYDENGQAAGTRVIVSIPQIPD